MVNGGSADRGKCTIEVVVDGTAEIEIRGDQGTIRNLSGRPAEWRRFECNAPLPRNPAGFRFAGVDGRGRQDLIRDPRQGGVAVVRIEDSQGGAEGYTFDLSWAGDDRGPAPGGGFSSGGGGGDRYPGGGDRYPGRDRPGRRFTTEQAVNVCQDAVRRQAGEGDRFRGRRVEFVNTRIDDNPGRNDWVVGVIDVFRGRNGWDGRYRFSCSVNFDTGQVRSAEIESRRYDRDWRDYDRH